MVTLEEKVLSMRMDEFGFARIGFSGSDKDVFPKRMHIVKTAQSAPFVAYDVEKHLYVQRESFSYAIAELYWDDNDGIWELRSYGTRFLEDGTEQLNKWILDFCEHYEINEDGELCEVNDGCVR